MPPTKPQGHSFDFLTVADLKTIPEPAWLVEGVLRKGGFAQLYGGAGSYKTFVALNWALSIAAGVEWRSGCKVEQGPVVYIIGEGLKKFYRRVESWLQHRNLPESAVMDNIRFIPEAVQLLEPAHITGLIAGIHETFPEPPKLTIIDTLSRSLVGVDEDKSQSMTVAIAAVQQLYSATQTSTLLLHHSPYSEERGRGSSSLPGALDAIIGIRKQNKTNLSAELYCTKQKDDDEFEPLGINLIKQGESLVATFGDRPKLVPRDLDGPMRLVWDQLDRVGTVGMDHKTWLRESGLPKSTFNRFLKLLKDNDLIHTVGPLYFASNDTKIIQFPKPAREVP